MSNRPSSDKQRSVPPVSVPQHRWRLTFWITASVVGLILRLVLIQLGPGFGYPGDHDDFVRWGIQAADEGVLTLYDHPPPRWNLGIPTDVGLKITQRKFDRLCNYPPLSGYLLYNCGLVFKAVSQDRLINTMTSRTIFASYTILGDFLLAAGCAALVFHFRPGAACWTYLFVLLLPPFWWDTVIWGQTDTTILAPIVWIVWAMVRQRWFLAGALYGTAIMIKPQAVTLVPLWGYAILTTRPVRKPVLALATAAVTAFVVSLPFTLHSGLAWLRASYIENILHEYPAITLKAFNLWYADLLWRDSYDVSAKLVGLTRDAWGKILLVAALALDLVAILRRWGRDPRALVLYGQWTLLAIVMLPTRVHERYLLLAIPLLVVAAMLWHRFWPGLLVLVMVAMAQVTWPMWMKTSAGDWPQHEQIAAKRYAAWRATLKPEDLPRATTLDQALADTRKLYQARRNQTQTYEWCLTALALAATIYTMGATLALGPEPLAGNGRQGDRESGRQGERVCASGRRPQGPA